MGSRWRERPGTREPGARSPFHAAAGYLTPGAGIVPDSLPAALRRCDGPRRIWFAWARAWHYPGRALAARHRAPSPSAAGHAAAARVPGVEGPADVARAPGCSRAYPCPAPPLIHGQSSPLPRGRRSRHGRTVPITLIATLTCSCTGPYPLTLTRISRNVVHRVFGPSPPPFVYMPAATWCFSRRRAGF